MVTLLVLCWLLGPVSSVSAGSVPGRPIAKSPTGTISKTKPTFKWARAARASRYEVRVYRGTTLLVKKTGVARLSWTCSKVLPRGVSLTWKVRARNAAGYGRWSRSLRFKVAPLSSAKTITSFTLPGQVDSTVIDQTDKTIAVTMPFGSDLTGLVASFTTTGASVTVSGVVQVSGATPNDFGLPLTYRVTAADSSFQDYLISVAPAPAPKEITSFTLPTQIGPTGIDQVNRTIALTLPYGSSVTALVATFTTTGAVVDVGGKVQVSGVTVNDFTNPVTYRVTGADSLTRDYVVTVTVAGNPAKAITGFSFDNISQPVTGNIVEANHTIGLIVFWGISDDDLIATFTTTGASVTVAGVPQVSGVTPNNFTDPVTYTVTAEDGSSQDYVVTVYSYGKDYQGGRIAYILESDDLGYDPAVPHGLIAATADQSQDAQWSNITSVEIGLPATGQAIGTGMANTGAIVNQPGCTSGAAKICYDLVLGGYSDWYLPSLWEQNELYRYRNLIGGFSTYYYWNSSEAGALGAHLMDFGTGTRYTDGKNRFRYVRAIRSF